MKKRYVDMILFVILMSIIFLGILPIILVILQSFSAGWKWPEIFPHTLSLKSWKYVLIDNTSTLKALGVSFKVAAVVTLINLILAIPAADSLGRYEFKGKKLIESILLIPIIIPPIVIMMGMHKTFIRLNFTESIAGIVLAHILPTLPYMIRAITISFRNLGFHWEEQARMLGAGRVNRFFYVQLPFLLPGIIAGSSLTILISLSQYIITMLIGGGSIVTLPILMFPFINGGNESIGAVYSIIFAISAAFSLWIMDSFLKRYY